MSKTHTQQQDHRQAPWNKGRLIGQKRPLKPKVVWNIRARLIERLIVEAVGRLHTT